MHYFFNPDMIIGQALEGVGAVCEDAASVLRAVKRSMEVGGPAVGDGDVPASEMQERVQWLQTRVWLLYKRHVCV